jgi:hypothetical protein
MDALLNAALAGTAHGGQPPLTTGSLLDHLLAQLPADDPEQRILLAAGARAIYQQAGWQPQSGGVPIAPAPNETQPPCTLRAARLLDGLLHGQHADVLPEAVGLLRHARQRLPAELLPAALDAGTRTRALREELRAALGERGRWLAAFNPEWRWAASVAPSTPATTAAVWEEGAPDQRLAALRQMRQNDPAQAREWLIAVWKQEKADFRAEALQALAPGLALDDEALLEAALDDRSQGVRAQAARLLAGLPGSALAARMRERASALLIFAPGPSAGGRLRGLVRAVTGRSAGGRLEVNPPETLDPAWQRDGIVAKPPSGLGERAWWLTQTLAAVPPSYWSDRFAAPPADLIAAACQSDWQWALLEGWARAAVQARDSAWAAALWEFWYGAKATDAYYRNTTASVLRDVLTCLPPEDASRAVEQTLTDAGLANPHWRDALTGLPAPWTRAFSERYLALLDEHVRKAGGQYSASTSALLASLPIAATALAPAVLPQARTPRPLPESGAANWQILTWQQRLDQFTATIQIRQQLREEIRP